MHIAALHARGDEESFVAAAEVLGSPDPDRRSVAADILAQLGAAGEERPFREPAFRILLEQIESETHPSVLASITSAFGHLADPRGIGALHALSDHRDVEVRRGVAFGLLGHDDDLAVATLVALSTDPDAAVRDWATFGLGTQIDRDDEQVRDALVARLDDEDRDTRGEALRGLAARGDDRAIPRLLIELGHPCETDGSGTVQEALLVLAARTADPRLCPRVEAARRAWERARPGETMPDDLRAAVETCRLMLEA